MRPSHQITTLLKWKNSLEPFWDEISDKGASATLSQNAKEKLEYWWDVLIYRNEFHPALSSMMSLHLCKDDLVGVIEFEFTGKTEQQFRKMILTFRELAHQCNFYMV